MTRWLETDSLSNQNIASALAIGAYTADADRMILCQWFADQVAGGGDYIFYLTHQIAGAGSAYRYVPKTTATVDAAVTAIAGQSIMVAVRSGDVLTLYLDGLAGDTTTPDTTVRWFELAALRPTTADRTLDVSAGGEAGVDWANVGSPTTTVGLSGTTVKAVSDGVTLADDAITSAKFDEATAYPLKAADSGSTYIARTGADSDTLETLSDQLDGVEPADVWSYATRTLTQSSSGSGATTTTGTIERRRGDSWSISITGLGALTGYTSLWFTVKTSYDDADTSAVLQVKLNSPSASDGLMYVNRVAATDSTMATITVDDGTAGNITIAVDESITANIAPRAYYYDVQTLISDDTNTPEVGTFTVTNDVTRAIA